MKLDCTEIGMMMTIVKDAHQTGGRSLEMEWEVLPKAGEPPVHIHPHALETYEILEGEMEFYVNGKWTRARKGDKVQVEKGEPHTFRNQSDRIVRVYNTHQPAMNFEGFFTGLHKFSNSGLIKNGKITFKGMMGLSTLYNSYPDEIVSVKPPAMAMKLLGGLGKLMGIHFK